MSDLNINELKLEQTLQFYPFSSAIDISFWHHVAKYQLEVKKLDQHLIPIHGNYSLSIQTITNSNIKFPMLMGISDSGLSPWDESEPIKNQIKTPGWLHLCDTKEDFSKIDKKQFLKDMGEKIRLKMETHEVLENPQLFNLVSCLSFPNLKNHRFQYWINFPAALPKTPYTQESISNAQEYFGLDEVQKIQTLIKSVDLKIASQGMFWLKVPNNENSNYADYEILPLSAWKNISPEMRDQLILVYSDPSALYDTLSWSLRNVLFYFHRYQNVSSLKIFCIKQFVGDSKFHSTLSPVIQVNLGKECDTSSLEISWTGWERDSEQKLRSRQIDLSAMMDPIRLAETSVDLNLKLMKWRLVPNLDLEKHSNLKCLLLGAGTLGCQVARTLLGYGVKHITFVDNGKVSYSNPVRQSLFEFEDCLNGGKPKAKCASEKLKKIYPKVITEGHQITIPMAGHPIAEQEIDLTKDSIQKLTQLIQSHDMVYLLTDSRESRWLPTLLCSSFNKPLINAALGFDSYVVMRHGGQISGENVKHLGCYFCTDVVAPTDSLSERTLDQQCTVTRPGLASIAGALAVELSISMLHHPLGILAKPPSNSSNEDDSQLQSDLGSVPHQIRGFLNNFQTMILEGPAYPQCIACSSKIIEAYRTSGVEFLFNIFENPEYLTYLTGLDDLLNNDLIGLTEWASDENEDDF